jgi:uncharacterized protein (DUF2225 family)
MRPTLFSFPVIALLAVAPSSPAEKFADVDKTCPVCETKFKARVHLISSSRGARLDLKPIGCTAPSPVPVCPKCGFIHFRDGDHPAAELKSLKEYAASDAYKKLVRDGETPHYRLAKTFSHLKRDPHQVAFMHLSASWEAEGDKARQKRYLEDCLAAYDAAVKAGSEEEDAQRTAKYLRVELQRRLGRFEPAKAAADELAGDKAFKEEPFPVLLETQLKLIGDKVAEPQKAPLGKEKD